MMSDYTTHVIDLLNAVEQFRNARNWQPYHTPAQLAQSISIEAAELLEVFQWRNGDALTMADIDRAADELADVMIYCLSFALACGFDVSNIIHDKMEKNAVKYPEPER